MYHFLVKRLLTSALMLFLLSFLIFMLMTLMPGDPLDALMASNPGMSHADIVRLKALYGLDQPGHIRYFKWLNLALSGDFGYSRVYKVPAMSIMVPATINTFILSLSSLIFSVFVSIFLGTLTALKPKSRLANFISFISFSGISLPSFWIGILLILVFSAKLSLLPAGGTVSIDRDGGLISLTLDRLQYLILPALSLSTTQIGIFTKYIRNSFLEVLHEDYIRTAYAKGASIMRVTLKHAFKNTLLPFVTVVGVQFGYLFSGAVITETVFTYNGLGRLIYSSIIGNDFNVAMIGLMVVVSTVLCMSVVTDILYKLADPRIEYDT